MIRSSSFTVLMILGGIGWTAAADPVTSPPNAGRGSGTVSIWNPHKPATGNQRLTIRVLVLNYNPIVAAEQHKRLSEVFRWRDPEKMVTEYKEAMEYASGGYLRFEIAEWRNLNEIYAKEDGHRYTIEEYVQNRRTGKGWGNHGNADYPRLLREQNVVPLVDDGLVDEVWVFSDHFFGLWEASMAGPGAFFINGGVYPQVPSRRPFAFYGFNYERGVAEMMHNTSHRTEATLNRVYGPWNLKQPGNNWEKFSANHDQSNGLAGVGTCHWPANAKSDYDYGNAREVASWADAFLTYPKLDLMRKQVSRNTWSRGPDFHLDYMKWYFAHVPRAAGVNEDERQNNWYKYIFDFQSHDAKGKPLSSSAELHARDVTDPKAATHVLTVAYKSAEHIDPASVDANNLHVIGPDGKRPKIQLLAGDERGERSYHVAQYQIYAPNGTWEKAPAGEYIVSLRADQVRTTSGTALSASHLGSIRVAGLSGPTALSADKDTTLLASFDGNAETKPGKAPNLTKELRYESGVVGKGGLIGTGAALRYSCDGVLDPKAGTIEFWLQPKWNGNSGKSHVFFQAGRAFDNCLLLQIDGANNVRLLTWGDNPATPAAEKNVESGVGFSGAGWKSGEWHHLAATWSDSGRILTLYVDGRLAGATDKGVVIGPLSEKNCWIGSGIDGANPAEAVFDELRISKRARSDDEVKSAATAGRRVDQLTIELPSTNLSVGSRGVIRALGKSKSGPSQELTRDVAWSSSDSKVATVYAIGTLRVGQAGDTTITARRGELTASIKVKVTDAGLPTARLQKAGNISRPGPDPVTVVVAYEDPDGIRRESLGMGDIRIVGPNGFHQFPELISVERVEKGFAATYRVTPLSGRWSETDRGAYTIEMKAYQVVDTKGNYVSEVVLGQFEVLPQAKPN